MRKADQIGARVVVSIPPTAVDLSMPAVPSTVSSLRHQALDFALAHGANQTVTDAIAVAVSEAVTNSVKYAYEQGEVGVVRLAASVVGGLLEIRVTDEGLGFREHEPDGLGMGLKIIASVSNDLDISQGADGTEVWMKFSLELSGDSLLNQP
jgi:anti-sigma regulatory factor (Ser/Thr protein kinase)